MAPTPIEQHYKVARLEHSTEITPCVRRHFTFQWLIGFLAFWLDNSHVAQHRLDISASQQARQEVVLSTSWQPTAAELWVKTPCTHFQAASDEPPEIGYSTGAPVSGHV